MTGEKDRYKTHEQLWKLEDGSLSTPQHDELVLQLLNPENAGFLFTGDELRKIQWCYKISHVSNETYREEIMEFIKGFECEGSEYNRIAIKSEVPVRSKNGFIIGYIDVQISFRHRYHFFLINLGKEKHKIIRSFDFQNDDDSRRILARFELYTDELSVIDADEEILNIEAKPIIKSFGETLRQINTYKVFNPKAKYIIYSPDTRFRAAFESQGIKFITPADLGINM